MSIFTDIVSTVGKSAWNKVFLYIFLFLCFVYTVNKIGGWISEKFTSEPTKAELTVQNTQQAAVIDAQGDALKKKDDTIEMAKDLTVAAVQSMEDRQADTVKAVGKQAQIASNLDRASTINKAEVIKITALEKDEAIKAQKLIEADVRLVESQNLEIEEAYRLALQRSGLQPT